MIHYEQRRRPEDQSECEQRTARGRNKAVDREEQGKIRQGGGEAEVENSAWGVDPIGGEQGDGRVEKGGWKGEEVGEMGEERRVIEGPNGGGIEVPLSDGEGGGQGQPVAMHLEIRAPIGGDEQELDACGDGEDPCGRIEDSTGW